MIKWISSFFAKKQELQYPEHWAIVDFSPIARSNGITNNQNKIITEFFYNRFGVLETKNYSYNDARVYLLRTLRKIPVYDKTHKDIKFPIFGRVLPAEAIYKTR